MVPPKEASTIRKPRDAATAVVLFEHTAPAVPTVKSMLFSDWRSSVTGTVPGMSNSVMAGPSLLNVPDQTKVPVVPSVAPAGPPVCFRWSPTPS